MELVQCGLGAAPEIKNKARVETTVGGSRVFRGKGREFGVKFAFRFGIQVWHRVGVSDWLTRSSSSPAPAAAVVAVHAKPLGLNGSTVLLGS